MLAKWELAWRWKIPWLSISYIFNFKYNVPKLFTQNFTIIVIVTSLKSVRGSIDWCTLTFLDAASPHLVLSTLLFFLYIENRSISDKCIPREGILRINLLTSFTLIENTELPCITFNVQGLNSVPLPSGEQSYIDYLNNKIQRIIVYNYCLISNLWPIKYKKSLIYIVHLQ